MIVADNVRKIYGSAERQVVALDRVNFQIDAGARVALVGRSGSGKTTLLNLLAGLDRPTDGQLTVDDETLEELTSRQLARFRLQKVGVVFQSFQLIGQRTALQNAELPLILAGVAKRRRRELARECLERVGLEKRLHHRPFQLSGGEQQRVAMARAIVHRPRVILADEPTGNLDSKTADQVIELLLQIGRESGSTLVLITHDRHLAEYCADQVFQLDDGILRQAQL